jgi:hypothetical protein
VTRLNDAEKGRIIVVGQRLHEEDVAGVCLETGFYRHLNLPAIAQGPATYHLGSGRTHSVRTGDLLYYPQDVLDRLRLEMGPAKFTAQYLQDLASADNPFIRWHKIARYAEAPPSFRRIAMSRHRRPTRHFVFSRPAAPYAWARITPVAGHPAGDPHLRRAASSTTPRLRRCRSLSCSMRAERLPSLLDEEILHMFR